MSKTIKIRGFVTIKQGEKVLVKKAINHFVDAGLKGLISTIISGRVKTGAYGTWMLWYGGWKMYLGQNTDIPTVHSHTGLQTPIGGAPGTAPDSQNVTVKDGGAGGDADGVYHVKFIATWNSGTLPAVTLGEAALYLKAPNKTTFKWEQVGGTYNPAVVMVSRLSSADTDFGSFVIDDTEPLVAEWTVEISFA